MTRPLRASPECVLAHHGRAIRSRAFIAYDERLVRLQSAGVALWDALQACVRPGSLDASINEEVVNDFPAFFAKHPTIKHVLFNGSIPEWAGLVDGRRVRTRRSAGGFPAMTGNVPFLMKDVVLLAASIYLLKQDVVRVSSARI